MILNNSDQAICKLCMSSKPLQRSHIISKLFMKASRSSMIGRRFRDSQNKVVQDSIKFRLCCQECEGRFSRFESVFAQEVLQPYLNRQVLPCVSEDAYRLADATAWRGIQLELAHQRDPISSKFTAATWRVILQAEEKLRRALLSSQPCADVVHLMLLDPILPDNNYNAESFLHMSQYLEIIDLLEVVYIVAGLGNGLVLVTQLIETPLDLIWPDRPVFKTGRALKTDRQKLEDPIIIASIFSNALYAQQLASQTVEVARILEELKPTFNKRLFGSRHYAAILGSMIQSRPQMAAAILCLRAYHDIDKFYGIEVVE